MTGMKTIKMDTVAKKRAMAVHVWMASRRMTRQKMAAQSGLIAKRSNAEAVPVSRNAIVRLTEMPTWQKIRWEMRAVSNGASCGASCGVSCGVTADVKMDCLVQLPVQLLRSLRTKSGDDLASGCSGDVCGSFEESSPELARSASKGHRDAQGHDPREEILVENDHGLLAVEPREMTCDERVGAIHHDA